MSQDNTNAQEPKEDWVINGFVFGALCAVFAGMLAGPAIGASLAALALVDSLFILGGG